MWKLKGNENEFFLAFGTIFKSRITNASFTDWTQTLISIRTLFFFQ